MNWAGLEADLSVRGLFNMGVLHDDKTTLVLVGAAPEMWPVFTVSTEYTDGAPNPVDRWSKRVIGAIADPAGWLHVNPSDGPPYLPFIAWAKSTGRFWTSPTGMLVHDTAGLMISIRGAIQIPDLVPLPPGQNNPSPCASCAAKPCIGTCPVGALSADAQYDVPACKAYLDTEAGNACMTTGCHVRRACPVSETFGRDPVQSAFHMRSFHPR